METGTGGVCSFRSSIPPPCARGRAIIGPRICTSSSARRGRGDFFFFFFLFFFFSSPTVRSAAERRLELDWTCNFGEYTRFDAQRSLDVCEHIRGRLCTRLTRAAAAAAGARVGDWRRGGCGVASSKRAVSRLRARSCGRRSSKTGRLRGRERGSRGGGGSGVYRLISLGVVADGARVAGACIDARLGQCA